jgi:polyhydroxybutyrate depolymerase
MSGAICERRALRASVLVAGTVALAACASQPSSANPNPLQMNAVPAAGTSGLASAPNVPSTAAGTVAVGGVSGRAGTAALGSGGSGGAGVVTTGAAGMSSNANAGAAAGSAGAGTAGVPSAGTSAAGATAGVAGAAAGTVAVAGTGGSGADSALGQAACTNTPLGAGDHTYTIKSANGLEYEYILSVPKTVDETQRTPLLLHWHALSSDPEEARSVTSIDAKAEAAKWLLVFPRSPDKSWDVGSCCTSTVGGQSRDEEVFARELVKDITSKACVDSKRIYTSGFSNGGMISQMLACKMTDVIAAAAPMGSTLTIPKSECTPSRPIPIFMVAGTADPLVGYSTPGFAGGIVVPEDVQFWVDQNKCTGSPETFLQMGKATCTKYTNCAAGAEVAFCSIDGMGHCVPGMKKESASNCLTKSGIALGMPNDDIDALQMDNDFLMRFTLP